MKLTCASKAWQSPGIRFFSARNYRAIEGMDDSLFYLSQTRTDKSLSAFYSTCHLAASPERITVAYPRKEGK